jgi:hypothetical protein
MRRLMLCAATSLVLALAAQAQEELRLEGELDAEWLERHPLGEPVDPDEVEFLDEAASAELPPLVPGRRYAEIDGVVVELDPESYELLQLIRRSAGVVEAPRPAVETNAEDLNAEPRGRSDGDGGGRDQAQGIPRGHLPSPGSCRVWHPDRPPGQQPPPTSCDVEVPDGAFLVRG